MTKTEYTYHGGNGKPLYVRRAPDLSLGALETAIASVSITALPAMSATPAT